MVSCAAVGNLVGNRRRAINKSAVVNTADVQRITEKYLDPNKMALVIVGDKAKIDDQLAPFRK
jgi:hypothetical protein